MLNVITVNLVLGLLGVSLFLDYREIKDKKRVERIKDMEYKIMKLEELNRERVIKNENELQEKVDKLIKLTTEYIEEVNS